LAARTVTTLPRGIDSLSPLTGIEEHVPACDEEMPVLDLEFQGGRVLSSAGKGTTADLILRVTPGPSFLNRQGQVQNLLLGAKGLITLGTEATAHTLGLAMDHRGSLFASSTFTPETGDLDLTIPVALDDRISSPLWATLSVSCRVDSSRLSCSGAELLQEALPWESPSLDSLFVRAEKAVILGRKAIARAAGVGGFGEAAVVGCSFLCPKCRPGGCDSNCPAEGGGCGHTPGEAGCCFSSARWACRNCSVTTCATVRGTVKVLGASPEIEKAAEACPFTLTRSEELTPGERFLMEEWAVVAYQRGPQGLVANLADASNLDFARTKAACLTDGRLELGAKDDPATFVLLVDHTIHPINERHIPTPSLRFEPMPTSQVGPEVRAAVRFQVDDSRAIQRVDLLYADGELPPRFLDEVSERLEIVYETEGSHWLSAYAIFRVAGARVEMSDSLVSLPQCCTGCPPPPYVCN
ncbi:MAG: hypothetical protein KDD47_17810, partial [Acidobacteria bacterium]|nr:hypothetical protein [Acidobacteriota bacterium]